MTKNFLALGISQIANFILPILTMPFLIEKIHPEGYGKVQFAYTSLLLLGFLVDFSHNITAPREIAVNNLNPIKLQLIINKIFTTRLFLAIVSLLILCILLLTVPKYGEEWIMYLLGSTMVFGFAFQSTWFFQGIEQMNYIAYSNIVGKLITLALIFLLVNKPAQYIYVPFFWGIGNLITALLLIVVMIKRFHFIPSFQTDFILSELKDGFAVFISNISVIIYMNVGTVLLGFYISDSQLGMYSISERIVMASRQVLSVFSQVIYPTVCKLSLNSFKEVLTYLKKMFVPFLMMVTLGCICLYTFSSFWIVVIAQHDYEVSSTFLKQMSVIPLIVCLNIPAYQLLIAYNIKSGFTYIMIIGAFIFIALNLILDNLFREQGAIWSIIITETLITITLYISLYYYRNKIKVQEYNLA